MKLRRIIAVCVAFMAGPAAACGICLEDKVAATYDHALVARATARGQVVVFAEARAPIEAARLSRALASAAAHSPGVAAGSVRTSTAPASISFALDPRACTPMKALAAIRETARVPGLELELLKVVGATGRPDPSR